MPTCWHGSGVTVADAFIACWESKFEFDLLRPVTFIRRHIDPKWEDDPDHATLPRISERAQHAIRRRSSRADPCVRRELRLHRCHHERDGLKRGASQASRLQPRRQASRGCMAASISAPHIVRGLEQGRCVGAHGPH